MHNKLQGLDTRVITKIYDHITYPIAKSDASSSTQIIDDQQQNITPFTTSTVNQEMKQIESQKSQRSKPISSTVENVSWQNKHITTWNNKDVAGISANVSHL